MRGSIASHTNITNLNKSFKCRPNKAYHHNIRGNLKL